MEQVEPMLGPMARAAMAREAEVTAERAVENFVGGRVSWGGIFAGVLLGAGTVLLLSALGLAIGVSVLDPQDAEARSIGTATGLWAAATLLIALFVAGWGSTRLSQLRDLTVAYFEGALTWVLTVLLVLWLAASGVTMVTGGAGRIISNAVPGVPAVTRAMDLPDLGGGSPDEILARLRDPQTASRIATLTGMSSAEVGTTLNDIAARAEAARDDPARVVDEVRRGAQPMLERAKQRIADAATRAQPRAATGAWTSLGALLLSLIATLLGAALGRRHVRLHVRRAVTPGH